MDQVRQVIHLWFHKTWIFFAGLFNFYSASINLDELALLIRMAYLARVAKSKRPLGQLNKTDFFMRFDIIKGDYDDNDG